MLDETLIPDADTRPRCAICDRPKLCREERIEVQPRRWDSAKAVWRWLVGRAEYDPPTGVNASTHFYVCPDTSKLCPGWVADRTAIEIWRRDTHPRRSYSPLFVAGDIDRLVTQYRDRERSYTRLRAIYGPDSDSDDASSPATDAARREVARDIHDRVRTLCRGRYADDCHPPPEGPEQVQATRADLSEVIETVRSLRDPSLGEHAAPSGDEYRETNE